MTLHSVCGLEMSLVVSFVWPPHCQLDLLFGKVVEPFCGALQEEERVITDGPWSTIVSHYFLLLPCVLSVDVVWSDSPCSWHQSFPATSSPPWWTAISGTNLFLPEVALLGYFITETEVNIWGQIFIFCWENTESWSKCTVTASKQMPNCFLSSPHRFIAH